MENTNEMNEELVQVATENVVAEVVKSTSTGGKITIGGLAILGMCTLGYGIYKGVKFVVGKVSKKNDFDDEDEDYTELPDEEE